MADQTFNLTEQISLSDTLTIVQSPERYVQTFLDTVTISEVFSEVHNERHVIPFTDTVLIEDVFSQSVQRFFLENFEDTMTLSDVLSVGASNRFEQQFNEVITISDELQKSLNERIDQSFTEVMTLVDLLIETHTERPEAPLNEIMQIGDELIVQFGLQVVDGTGDGNYDEGEIVNLVAVPPLSTSLFVRWLFNKFGIDNIFNPTTTLVMPQGGGIVTAQFIDIGMVDIPNGAVIVLTLDNYTYVVTSEGNEIQTTETAEAVGASMGVAKHNFTIEQGSVFEHIIIYRDADNDPVDLTGYTAEMQIRNSKEGSLIQTLSSVNGYLVLGGVAGTITIGLPADQTDALDFVWGVYDLELYPAANEDNAVRLLEGKINLNKQVTQ